MRFVAGVTPEVPLDEIDAVPPLLSLLCAELNEQRVGPEDVIRPEQLHGRGEDILDKFYNRCFDSHPPAVRVFVEERLLSHEGFRESTAEDTARHELQRAGLSAADADTALKQLVDNRLLVVEERGGIRRVELTHDILTGIARRSRDLRREREATAARRRARSRLAVISIVIGSLFACVSVLAALWTQRQNAKLKALLEEAARSVRLVALDKIQSGEHADALAHLGRAHRYLPSSSLTAEIALPLILSSPLRSDLAVFRGHGGYVSSAQFSADGKRVLTASDDKTARLWPLLPVNIEVAEWFGDFLMFLGGQRIGEDGEMKILSNSERHAVESRVRQFARVKDDYSLLLRWQLTTTSDRTVDPYGTITQKQLPSELISQGQGRDAMQRAYNLDPWNPVVHLALAEFEEDPKPRIGCATIRSTACQTTPILERQAADMLRKQQQPGLALEFIDRALKHTPQDPAALALRAGILKDLNR